LNEALSSLVAVLTEDPRSVPALLTSVAVLLGVAIVLLAVLLRRTSRDPTTPLVPKIEALAGAQERAERLVQEELKCNREESAGNSRHLREEVGASIKGMSDSVEKRVNEMRGVVDVRLQQIQQESGKKLDAMRETVEEKLQGTLEKRLGESFQQVSERLEAVHKGLGEMQTLATGVGDLKKVLTNVKTRGTWGEIQLGNLLEQMLTPAQYDRNVATKRGGSERVDFAIRLPGPDQEDDSVVWLPVDAKFPQEDYQRLVEAQERGDLTVADEASRQLEARIKEEGRSIRDKYVNPPRTTDFAVMFLPTEGLYAEVLRRPGLAEGMQQQYRVTIAGPTTLAALLNSLQMGFRTLAIQKRSSEVWKLLGAVKKQFGQFTGILEKVEKKLHEASSNIGDASKKSRTIESRLRSVQELPSGEAERLLPELGSEDTEE
jgi:DNA recombination protein RmuC